MTNILNIFIDIISDENSTLLKFEIAKKLN